MSGFPHPTTADAITMLRTIAAFAADPRDPTTTVAEDYVRRLDNLKQAGYLNNPEVFDAAGLTIADIRRLRMRLEAIAENGRDGN